MSISASWKRNELILKNWCDAVRGTEQSTSASVAEARANPLRTWEDVYHLAQAAALMNAKQARRELTAQSRDRVVPAEEAEEVKELSSIVESQPTKNAEALIIEYPGSKGTLKHS